MNTALLFAGGSGVRMTGSPVPKQFIEVNGKSIIIQSILNFEKHEEIDAISVVCIETWLEELKNMLKRENIKKVGWTVSGAGTGQQSIYNGLKAIANDATDSEKTIVLISDGVRPIVTKKIISDCIERVKKYGSCITVHPVPETIVELDSSGKIINIPIRSRCFLSKAPQGFYLSDLMSAHEKSIAENRFDCTNSAELMYRYGFPLYTVLDSDMNIKITTPLDLKLFKTILDGETKNEL